MAGALINRHRNIAVAVRRSRAGVSIIAHSAGKLVLQQLSDRDFRDSWQEYDYPLDKLLERFLAHARLVGATKGALAAIERLCADPMVTAPRLL